LISTHKRAEAKRIVSRVHYIELAHAPNFQQIFIQASYIEPYLAQRKRRGDK